MAMPLIQGDHVPVVWPVTTLKGHSPATPKAVTQPPRAKKTSGLDLPCLAAAASPQNTKAHPMRLGIFHAEAIVHLANALAQLIQNPRGLQRWNAGFHGIFITGHRSSSLSDELGSTPLSGGIHDQLMEQRPTYRADFALDITLALRCCGPVDISSRCSPQP